MQTPDHGSRQRNRQHGEHHVQQRGNQLNPRNQGREKTAFRKRGDSRHGQPRNPHSGKTASKLVLKWEGPGLSKKEIPASAFSHGKESR